MATFALKDFPTQRLWVPSKAGPPLPLPTGLDFAASVESLYDFTRMTHDAAKGDDALWLGLTAWYMTVLALCATATPDQGFLGMLLSLLPPQLQAWLYAPAAGLLTYLLWHCISMRAWAAAGSLALSALISLVFAGTLEWAQAWQSGRAPVVAHLAWATLGILFMWCVWLIRSRRTGRPEMPVSAISLRHTAGRARKGLC